MDANERKKGLIKEIKYLNKFVQVNISQWSHCNYYQYECEWNLF